MNKKRTLIIRIIAIILCALMVLGVVAGAITVFAAEAVPAVTTGSTSQALPITLGVVAVLLIVICAVLPRFMKKDEKGEETDENQEK